MSWCDFTADSRLVSSQWETLRSNTISHRTFSQLFFLYWWAAEQRILAHQSEQPTAGCRAIFHKYVCYIKHGGIITNLNLWNPWGYVTDVSKCHNMGVWSMDYITFYDQKHIAPLVALFWFLACSRQAAMGTRICETPLLAGCKPRISPVIWLYDRVPAWHNSSSNGHQGDMPLPY